MIKASTIGLDLAKNVFQVHGISDDGTVVIRRRLRRAEVVPFFSRLPPCLVGMEACATSHYWARELGRLGHEIRMIPPRYVKPVRQARQERRPRCRGHLRGGSASVDAVRAVEDG
jgi:transposase